MSSIERLEAESLVAHLQRQIAFSARTFGPGRRTGMVCDHIRKELAEIEAEPDKLEEWIDVILLGLDGAWRTGATPAEILDALRDKQARNEARAWPDWRTQDPNRAILHHRDGAAMTGSPSPEIEARAGAALPDPYLVRHDANLIIADDQRLQTDEFGSRASISARILAAAPRCAAAALALQDEADRLLEEVERLRAAEYRWFNDAIGLVARLDHQVPADVEREVVEGIRTRIKARLAEDDAALSATSATDGAAP